MALNRISIPSPNYSSRGGAAVRLVVLHTAQGARTARDLGAFFARPSSGVSSHVGIDDALGVGTIAQYVPRPQKAWTQGNANPVAVSAELCAFAEWGSAEWDRHPVMLQNTASWIAEECAALGIPITKLTAAQAQGSGRGVCQHVDLGSWGGGHWDCGPAFPIDRVLEMARSGTAPAPEPPHPTEEEMSALTATLDRDGNLVCYGVAPNGDLWEITTKPADPNTPMTKTYRWSNITANGQNGQKLAV